MFYYVLKGSTYIAVVPLTAIVSSEPTNLFGYTKYLTEPEPGQL